MTILFITNNLPPVVDGVGDYTYNIARQFAMHRHKVYIACRENAEVDTHVEGMTIVPCVKAWNWSCYKPIVRLIREKGIEVVSLQYVPHGFHPKGLPFPLIQLVRKIKKCNIKLFTFCHELYVGKEKGNFKRNLLNFLMRDITKRIILQSDFIATSINIHKIIIKELTNNQKRVSIIPISSNIPTVAKSTDELKALKNWIAPQKEIIISFLGVRNIDISLQVLKQVKAQGYKIKILIIGKTLREVCKDEDYVYRTGILPLDELGQYLQISDILILPENKESGCSFKSGSLMAGLKNGLTVLTNKGRMTDDLLKDGENIVFTDFDDTEIFKSSLIELINNPQKRNSIGKSAEEAVSYISWENTYDAYINILIKGKKFS